MVVEVGFYTSILSSILGLEAESIKISLGEVGCKAVLHGFHG
jgi:hypothetical protein